MNNTEVIISSSGTKGDVHPLLGIAFELKKRNYAITFIANEYFEKLILSHGFKFISTGTEQQYNSFHSDERLWDAQTDILELGFDSTIRPAIEISYKSVIDQHKINSQLMVIGTYPLFNGAVMAAEALAIACTSIILSPMYVSSYQSPPAPQRWLIPAWLPMQLKISISKLLSGIAERHFIKSRYFSELNILRQSFGLETIHKLSNDVLFTEDNLQIGLFPEWFGMRVSDWPENLELVGFPLFDEIVISARDDADRFIANHGKPIVFTTGTGVKDTDKLFSDGVDICATLGVSGILVGNNEHKKYSNQPKNILNIGYVDFEYILPKCLAIVHHGGIGTLAQAVKAGIPQIIRPLAFDQNDNADRVKRLGLGTYIRPEIFCSRETVYILRKILGNQELGKNISLFSKSIKSQKTLPEACNLIENKLLSHYSSEKQSTIIEKCPEKEFGPRISFLEKNNSGESNLSCISRVLAFHGIQVGAADLLNKHPYCRKNLSLRRIMDILGENGLRSRALYCDLEKLKEIGAPCIIHWRMKQYAVICDHSDDGVLLYDPLNEKAAYSWSELARHYGGVVLDITSNEERACFQDADI